MPHEADNGSRDHDGNPRQGRDRDITVNEAGLPTSAGAIRAIALALYQAGYDGRDEDDMHRLADDLRAWRAKREADRKRATSHKAWAVVILSSVATAVVGALIQWLPPFVRILFAAPPNHGPH